MMLASQRRANFAAARALIFADFRANFDACIHKRPCSPLGTPDAEVRRTKTYPDAMAAR